MPPPTPFSGSKSIIIVGAGIGGLAAAVRLAAKGHHVTVLEKNPQIGGKLNRWQVRHPDRPADRPFLFDTGPSLITLPKVFDDLFAAAGERREDHLTLKPLDPIARYYWADGTRLDWRADSAALSAEIERFAPGAFAGLESFLQRGRHIWDLSGELFLENAPEQVLNGGGKGGFDPKRALSMLTVPLRIGMFSRFHKLVNKHVQNPRLREILYQYATYSGASPFLAPATLAVIPYAEWHFGGWYIQGGLYSLATALANILTKLGGRVRTAAPVAEILIEPGTGKGRPATKGVRLDTGEIIEADVVVANSDVVYTYSRLIAPRFRPSYSDAKLQKLEPGGSGMVLLLGVDGTYDKLAHHTKFMPADYTSDLRAMFETRTIPDDPCIYVCASTRTDPTQAPAGCENLFVLCSAPALHDTAATTNWQVQGKKYRDRIVDKLEHTFGLTDLSTRIVAEKWYTPTTLQSDYNANAGAIYGIGSNSRRTAFLRPPNRDKDIDGLFHAGGATHPGGGLPLVALSGKIVSELIDTPRP